MTLRSLFEKKQSKARALIAMSTPGQPVWTPKNYSALAKAGFERNVIAYRCIRLVSEAASSAPLKIVEGGAAMSAHPLLSLLSHPNAEQSGATLLENLYGYLQTSGNAYVEAVTLDGEVRELYALRPDRMKALIGASGWAEGWEEAVRVAPAVYEAPLATGGFKIPASAPQFGKPAFELMNLPLLRDDDDEAAPYLAVYADPWPGAIALYRGNALAATASARAMMGRLETAAPSGVSGRWDERALKVRLSYGTLVSRSEEEVFAGANAAAIETAAGWEIIQFRDATLESGGAWTLKGLLRGQNGTEEEAAMGAAAGARFVMLNGAVSQAALPFDLRGLSFDWSAGPADDHPSEPTFRTKTFAGEATGLKPLSPAHLVVVETPSGDMTLSWKRRTRKGGDSWEGEDVPLSEAYERYRIEIHAGASLIRSAESPTTGFVYAAADIAADFPPAIYPAGRPPLTIRVAQVSDKVGPGKWASVGV